MDKPVNADETVAFYVLELDADRRYRGLGRLDMCFVRLGELELGLGLPDGAAFEWAVPDRGDLSRDHIPSTPGVVGEVRRYFAGIDWAALAKARDTAWVGQAWELVGAGRVYSESDVRAVRDRLAEASREKLNERSIGLQYLGVDILEWPSAWSVMERHEVWTQEPPELNEHGLAATYDDAIEIWERYLKSSDPDFGSVSLYRFMAVYGCGRLWPPTGAGPGG